MKLAGSTHLALALTITDVERARAFYSDVVGLQVVATVEPKVFLSNGTMLLALGPAPNRPIAEDRFDENRVGLDYISFKVVQEQVEQGYSIGDDEGRLAIE